MLAAIKSLFFCLLLTSFSFTESIIIGFPGSSDGKKSACNAGDLGLMPGSGRFPEEGNGNPLQYSCLENSMDKGVHGVTKSRTRLINTFTLPLSSVKSEGGGLISKSLSPLTMPWFSLSGYLGSRMVLAALFLLKFFRSGPVFPSAKWEMMTPSACRWASLVAQLVKHLPATQETWVRSLGQEDPLEKEMETHSSILAWRIPWTEEPGRLQSYEVIKGSDTA